MAALQQPVEDRVGNGCIADPRIPVLGGQLARNDRRTRPSAPALLKTASRERVVPELQRTLGIARDELSMLWDCDFLLGERTSKSEQRYVLCGINVSSDAPFPDAAIQPLVQAI